MLCKNVRRNIEHIISNFGCQELCHMWKFLSGESPSTLLTPCHCCRVNIKSFTVTISPHITRLAIEHRLSYNSVIYRLHDCQRYIPTLLVNATVNFASAFNVTSGVNRANKGPDRFSALTVAQTATRISI